MGYKVVGTVGGGQSQKKQAGGQSLDQIISEKAQPTFKVIGREDSKAGKDILDVATKAQTLEQNVREARAREEAIGTGLVPTGVTEGGVTYEQPVETQLQADEAKAKFEKMTAQEVAMSSLEPKIAYLMDVGGRGLREFKTEAKDRFNVELDFESGGVEFWKANLLKKGMNMARLTPVLDAADKLRPEIGFEVMRQIGPFRSAHAGMVFTETLADFEGHIPSDIAKSATTMTKSFAGGMGNKALVEEVFGRELSRDEQVEKIKQYEANLIRGYNKAYRQMGISTKFHGAGLDVETIADNSKFTEAEEGIINNFLRKYPDKTRKEITVTLIDEGLL